MFGFNSSAHKTILLIDIGSSSVGIGIICLHPDSTIENVWEHREHTLPSDQNTAALKLKQIKTALTNALLEFAQAGINSLEKSNHDPEIAEVQVTIAAPWSYIVTRNISLHNEHPFVITNDLLTDLVRSAKEKNSDGGQIEEFSQVLKLRNTHGEIDGVAINGYRTKNPVDQSGRDVTLFYLETYISESLLEIVTDSLNKIVPKTEVKVYSFMYILYNVIRYHYKHLSEYLLLDVTNSATEMGIIRDTMLKQVKANECGLNQLSQLISENCQIPKTEAKQYLKDSLVDLKTRLNAQEFEKLQVATDKYVDELSKLFSKTGDLLAVPSKLFIHTDNKDLQLIRDLAYKALLNINQNDHLIHPINSQIFSSSPLLSNSLALEAEYYVQIKKYNQSTVDF